MEKLYSVGEFSVLINKKVKTLQKWDRLGILKAYRTPTDRRYYTHTQYLEYTGQTQGGENSVRENVIYVRVSTHNQKNDLKNQLDYLKKYTVANGINISNIFSDVGSGLNYKRKNWLRLLDDCFHNKINKIYITYSDRFVRFGFDWIKDLLQKYFDVEIVVIENKFLTPEQEVVNDLITIIHVFSSRIYGLRKYKRKISEEFADGDNS